MLVVAAIVVAPSALGDQPADYYDLVVTSSSEMMRTTLHETIDDHTRVRYTSSTSTDVWDVLKEATEDPNDAGRVLDIYKNESYAKEEGGNDNYNREHAWPKSHGFVKDTAGNYPYTDCHHLFVANSNYNSSRNNKVYGDCDADCTKKPTDTHTAFAGIPETPFPGSSNWTTTGTWETWVGRRGDVARALFYMDVRYEGGQHGVTRHPEPDLILTDDLSKIVSSTTNEDVAYMGLLSTLLEWHEADPVDDLERTHNEAVYGFQGNRNPFVDHPEWVACVFQDDCPVPVADVPDPRDEEIEALKTRIDELERQVGDLVDQVEALSGGTQ